MPRDFELEGMQRCGEGQGAKMIRLPLLALLLASCSKPQHDWAAEPCEDGGYSLSCDAGILCREGDCVGLNNNCVPCWSAEAKAMAKRSAR